MFADPALAARLDRVEARMCASAADALRDVRAEVMAVPLGGGIAVFARPGSPLNKIIGAGIDADVDEAELADIEEALRQRGEGARVELSTLARPDVGKMLTARGYRLTGFEHVLGLPLAGRRPVPSPPGVTVAPERDTALWGDVASTGFEVPDETSGNAESFPRAVIDQVMADMARAAGFQQYLARLDGEPAGAAAMRFDDRVAQLCGAATLPRFRRRGVQGALLDARLAEAKTAGCDLAVVTTSPGTQSQSNVQNKGFVLLYARVILVKPPAR